MSIREIGIDHELDMIVGGKSVDEGWDWKNVGKGWLLEKALEYLLEKGGEVLERAKQLPPTQEGIEMSRGTFHGAP